jgi:hypothetical protein
MAEQIVRAINEGVSGAMVWSYTNSGRIDGQWGWIGTQDRRFEIVPNLMNGFAVLMRPQRVGADIVKCNIARSDFSSFISAAMIRDLQGEETIWLINDHPVQRIRVLFELPKVSEGCLFRITMKDFDPELKSLGDIEAAPDGKIDHILPGMSIVAITKAKK